MNRYYLSLIATAILILGVSAIMIFQAKGYKLDLKNRRIEKTGIIAVSSIPTGAAVYLNGHLISATNANLQNLTPGDYQLKVTKEGFIPWEKKVKVEEELVTPVEITLFPAVPDLSPITFTGVENPKLSVDGQKIVYALRDGEKSGLWILDLADRPLNFSKDPKQIAKDTLSQRFSKSTIAWAPDSKTVVTTLQENERSGDEFTRTYLLSADQLNNDHLVDITTSIERTKKTWLDDALLKKQGRIAKLSNPSAQQLASSSANVLWSPDEKKFLVFETSPVIPSETKQSLPAGRQGHEIATDSANPRNDTNVKVTKSQVYDSVKDKIYEIPLAKRYVWYPDSSHLILVEDQSISIVEFSGENRSVIYNGNFDPNVIFPTPNGSKLIILSSFNPSIKEPNLYTISLR